MIKAQFIPAILLTLTFVVLTGIIFPVLIWAISSVSFPYQAKGSFIEKDNKIIASERIGQNFTLPEYFHPRPSAAGSGYDSNSSGGTNLGPTSKKLYDGISALAKEYREKNGLSPDTKIPVDAVTRSASGLDPHISPANAILQANRIAKARGVKPEDILNLINANTEERFLGIFGERRLNVLKLNLQLSTLTKS